MGRLVVKGSSKYFELASAVVSGVPFTMSAWYRPTTSNASGSVVSLGRTVTAGEYFALGVTAAAKPFFEVSHPTGSTFDALHGTSVTNGAWGHLAAVATSATSRNVYFNGVAGTANTTSAIPASLNRTNIGALISNTAVSFADGDIGEVAIWNVALTTDEITSLSKGMSPALIRPASLKLYAPMTEPGTGDTPDLIGGVPLTQHVTPATSTDHPPIIYPRQPTGLTLGASSSSATITQVAATVTATGGTQVVVSNVLLNASVAQVAATVTATGGTQTVSTVNNVAVAQVAGTVTATGGTQTVVSVANASIAQVAATVTATGGTQAVASVNNVSIAQSAATVTAAGGTQTIATVNNVALSQVAGVVTATGGTQQVVTNQSVSITQVAGSVTATGGTQTVVAKISTSVTQVAASVTATGGTQTIATVNNVAITQVAGSVTAAGGTQTVATVNNVAITQVAGTVTATGGTQAVATVRNAAIAQQAANVTASGGTQAVSAGGGGAVSASIAQVAATVTATGGTPIISSATGPLPTTARAPGIIFTGSRVAVKVGGNMYLSL